MSSEAGYRLVLVVEQDRGALSAAVRTLRGAGHHATGVSSYEEARRQLALDPPDVLLSAARLGDHHGLHLALVARARRVDTRAVILADLEDPVLQSEVTRAGASLVVRPLGADALLTLVNRLLAHARQPPRVDTAVEPQRNRRMFERRRLSVRAFLPNRRVGERRSSATDIRTVRL
jgi:DNA-binding NtrC family response regulator